MTTKDIPKREIYMGTIISEEQMNYQIDEAALHHTIFTGVGCSGKTVAAMRFAKELAHVRRKETEKGLRIVVMDRKQNWRKLANHIEPERFRFYSMGNMDSHPISINLWKVPKGVHPKQWADTVIELYCCTYGLFDYGEKPILAEIVHELYEKAGVYRACDKEDWKTSDEIKNASDKVTFVTICQRLQQKKEELEKSNGKDKNTRLKACDRLLERLAFFLSNSSIERTLYETSGGLAVDDLIGGENELTGSLKGMGIITVLESQGLSFPFYYFVFSVIASGFHQYAQAHKDGFRASDQNETVLIIEDADNVLLNLDNMKEKEFFSHKESPYDQIMNHAADNGLFIISITQNISEMPSSVISNAGLFFFGRLTPPADIRMAIRVLHGGEQTNDRDLEKWFLQAPIGYFVCKSALGEDSKDTEPVLVRIDKLDKEMLADSNLSDMG